MTRPRIPLWTIGMAAWFVVSWSFLAIFPPERGAFSERPFAKALLYGGVVGLAIMTLDISRNPRRAWLWGITAWGVLVCWSAWSGGFGDDPDIDQILGWGFGLGGVLAIPFFVGSLVSWVWRRAGRAIQERPLRWRFSVGKDSVEITRRNPDE